MPVGNSSQGIGLLPGEIMLNIDMNYQNIIWSHDPLLYENFIHEGFLNSYNMNFRSTLGLTDWLNITFSQATGIRRMVWNRDESSIHHRTETTLTDFIKPNGQIQAKGGVFGDSKILLKYLFKDVGMKEGSRIYFGLGIVIPSKSILLANPFSKPNDENDLDAWLSGEYDHRHFSLSNGVYKTSLQCQWFNKRFSNPIFYGTVFDIDIPLSDSKSGYIPGINYNISSSVVLERKSFKKDQFNLLPGGFLFGLSFLGFEEASWNGSPTVNSKSKMLVPSIGGIWPTNKGRISLSIQKPFFIVGRNIMVGIDSNVDDPLNNSTNVFEIIFGYRRNLGYMIPWL